MPNTYTQLHVHVVFTVQNRQCLIHSSWEDELYKFISGIVKNHKHKLIAINGTADHIHLFVGLHPTQSISDLMRIVKSESSLWINNNRHAIGRFQWQEGYGAFSYAHSQVAQVYNYVMNQKEHHKKMSFLDEYKALLTKFEIPFDPKFLFQPVESE